jgi:hypothetical protein
MISAETRTQIRQWFFAEHWTIGTIAQVLRLHPDTVVMPSNPTAFTVPKLCGPWRMVAAFSLVCGVT